jgi:5-methylcytosine-specific restriction endonuclease McrA
MGGSTSPAWFRAYRKTARYKAWRKRYYQAKREKLLQAKVNWVAANKERHKAYLEAYRESHREVQRQRTKDWRKKNKLRVTAYSASRRKKIRSTRQAEDVGILAFYRLAGSGSEQGCYYCRSRFHGTAEVDHIVPLERGGKHNSNNLCLACTPCNRRKHAKLPSEFIRSGQLLFDV